MPKAPVKSPKNKREFGLAIPNLPAYFLLFAVVVSLYGLFVTLERFMVVILLSSILTIAFYPVYKKILQWVKKPWLASLISIIFVVVIIVLPLTLLVLLLSREAYDTFVTIQSKVSAGDFDFLFRWERGGLLFDLKEKLRPIVDIDGLDLKTIILDSANFVGASLLEQSGKIFDSIKAILSTLIDFTVMLFVMFYFFRDAKSLKETLIEYSPLPTTYEKKIFKKLEDMVGAIIYGLFLTALVQGTLGGIGFWLAGISNPIFWGALIAFFALIPLVGTAVVWGPAALILLFTGEIGWGIFLLLWGMFIVGLVDNIMKPYLVSGKAHTYPLLTFLSIFGGIFAFGMKGILFGPVIMMLAVTFLSIYSQEYKKVLKD